MLARGFEQIHRAQRVHFKIEQGDVRRLVVRGLRGAMDDQVEAIFAEQRHHAVAVANIERHGSELPRGALEPFEIPQRVSRQGRRKRGACCCPRRRR